MEQASSESLDAIRELINIGVGRAASMLNDMTRSHIALQVPCVRILRLREFAETADQYPDECLAMVKLDFRGAFSGTTAVVFPEKSAAALVVTLMEEDSVCPELDAIRIETLKEVGNIIINGVMGSISNALGQHLAYSLPAYMNDTITNLILTQSADPDEWIVLAHTHFLVQDINVEGDIVLILEVGSMDALIEEISRQ
jgi:chemotaxis protein CheC